MRAVIAVVEPRPLTGALHAIPSKSVAHRLLILAALADRETVIAMDDATSEDVEATVRCLSALGAGIERGDSALRVTPIAEPPANPLLSCGESGSTLRFLLPVAAALSDGARFTGAGRLPDRPIADLLRALARGGAIANADRLPLTLRGRLRAGRFALSGDVTSQSLSGLLLATPRLPGDSEIVLTTPLASSAYVQMTRAAMRRFGVTVDQAGDTYRVRGGATYASPGAAAVEGDWSSAAFYLAAGALGQPVRVTGLNADSAQGDRRIAALLADFGAKIDLSPEAVTAAPGDLRALDVDVSEIPDLLPILAVVAANARGVSRFTGGARLRCKESDRLRATVVLLRALGGDAEETADGLTVRGGSLVGGHVDGFADHRIVMAAAIAAIACKETVVITGAEAARKSYPGFFADYQKLGGYVHER